MFQRLRRMLASVSSIVDELPRTLKALRCIVEDIERAARPDGELTDLLRATAELARAAAEAQRTRVRPANTHTPRAGAPARDDAPLWRRLRTRVRDAGEEVRRRRQASGRRAR